MPRPSRERTAPTSRLNRRVLLLLFALALASGVALSVALSSGSSGEGGGSEPEVLQRTLDVAVEGLCQAREDAAAGDVARARAVFQDKAHQFLHDLASATEDVDRQLSSDLLVAKYRVEGALSSSPEDGAGLAEALDALLQTVGRAATSVDLNAPACSQ